MIIIINGSGGCGKDTFIKFIEKFTPLYNISSINPYREAAKLLGWNGVKDKEGRLFLSDLKKLWTKQISTPFHYVTKTIRGFKKIL